MTRYTLVLGCLSVIHLARLHPWGLERSQVQALESAASSSASHRHIYTLPAPSSGIL